MQPHAATVEQDGDKARDPGEFGEDGADLGASEDDREVRRGAGAWEVDGIVDWLAQHGAVEEQEGAECLVLRAGADVSLVSERGEERGNVGGAQLLRVTLLVVDDETAHPVDVGGLGAMAEVAQAARLS